MHRIFVLCVLLCAPLIPCLAQDQRLNGPMGDLPYVMMVLSQYHVSGSFEYSGSCQINSPVPDFPTLHPPRKDAHSPLQALQEVFADHKNIHFTQDPKWNDPNRRRKRAVRNTRG